MGLPCCRRGYRLPAVPLLPGTKQTTIRHMQLVCHDAPSGHSNLQARSFLHKLTQHSLSRADHLLTHPDTSSEVWGTGIILCSPLIPYEASFKLKHMFPNFSSPQHISTPLVTASSAAAAARDNHNKIFLSEMKIISNANQAPVC